MNQEPCSEITGSIPRTEDQLSLLSSVLNVHYQWNAPGTLYTYFLTKRASSP